MSAYIVDKEHIDYLVFTAKTWRAMRVHHNGQWHEMTPRELGQMLWDENTRSVEHRYPSDRIDQLPGTIGDAPYIYDASPKVWARLDPVQVLKALKCYEYQACEHDGWKDSAAKWFTDALASEAIRHLPGYEDAEWGAPLPVRAASMR